MTTAKLRKIGGSSGVILRKSVLEKINMNEEGEFTIEAINGKIILSPVVSPHQHFVDFFEINPNFKADDLLVPEFGNDFDEAEPQW